MNLNSIFRFTNISVTLKTVSSFVQVGVTWLRRSDDAGKRASRRPASAERRRVSHDVSAQRSSAAGQRRTTTHQARPLRGGARASYFGGLSPPDASLSLPVLPTSLGETSSSFCEFTARLKFLIALPSPSPS